MNPILTDIKVQEAAKNVPEYISEKLPDSPFYAWDIECIDREGKYTDYPTQIAISGEDFVFVSKDNEKSVRSLFEAMLEKKKSTLITHNGFAFDIPVMRKWGYPETPMGHDTMYMAFFMDETQPRGLEALAVKYLGVPGWKESFSAKLGSEEFYFYNARDTWYTLQLFRLFSDALSRDKRLHLLEHLVYPVRKALDGMSERGVYLGKDYILATKQEVGKSLEERRTSVRQKMGALIEEEKPNPNSTLQIAKCLNKLHLYFPLTEKGNPQVSKDILQSYTSHPFVSELLDYRELSKKMSTYVKPYEKLLEEGGYAHPEYKMVSVETGRTSATKPNVQNLDRKLKGFFSAPPGKVLVSIDYNAIEFRVASWLAQEQGILRRFAENPGWDPHRYFASFFYKIPEHQVSIEQRQIAKSANFSQLFVGSGFTLWEYAKKQGIELKLPFCEIVHEEWHKTFPGFERFYLERKKEILKTGQVVCPTGFIRHFGDPELLRANHGQKFFGKLRQGVNVPVQNLAAHIAFLAMKKLQEEGFPMVLFVHDSISFEFEDNDEIETNVRRAEEIMCEYPIEILKKEYSVLFTVPLRVESEVKRSG